MALRVGILGPVTAWQGDTEIGVGQPRQRAVLAVLASRANRVVSRGELVDAVWGTQAPTTAEGGIYTYVAGLRRALDPGRRPRDPGTVVISTGAGYMLQLPPDGLDADVFERQLAAARADRAEGYLPGAERRLSEGLLLWRGAALAGVPGPFAEAERHRLSELRIAAAEERADVLLALGQNEAAVPELTVLVAENPLREHTRAMLMVALYRCGRQADALHVYGEAREVLAVELGIDPGPELSRVHQRVLAMDPELTSQAEADKAKPASGPAQDQASDAPPVAQIPVQFVPAQIPAQLPLEVSGFTGRRAELARLHAMLPAETTSAVPVALIVGMAGVGKTALAIRFGRQVSARFPDGHLYVNLRGFDPAARPLDSGEALRGFFEALGVAGDRIPESVEGQVGLFRTLTAGKRLLVVLDNARSAEQVRPLLPASPGCMVVITSRTQLTSLVAAEGARPMRLDVLDPSEATEFLRQRLGADRVQDEPGAVADIVRLCDCLPLALSVTAARAATTPGLTLSALADELRDSGAHVLDTGEEASTDIRAVFSWSYTQLAEPTARVFRLLGLHPGPHVGVPAAASMTGLSLECTRQALTELSRACMVAEPVPGRFSYHDLLRGYAAELALAVDGAEAIEAAYHRLLGHYLRTTDTVAHRLDPWLWPISMPPEVPGVVLENPRTYDEARTWLSAELPALLAAISHPALATGDFSEYLWRLPVLLAITLELHGRTHDLLAAQRVALTAARHLGDPEALGHASSQFGFACILFGDLTTAAESLESALEAFTACGNRAALGVVHFKLAMLNDQRGRTGEALLHAKESLRLRRAFGHRAAIAHAENGVGWFHAQLGQYSDALRHCRRALDLATETGSRTLVADTLDSLGLIHLGLNQPDKALNWYQQALAAYRALSSSPVGVCSALSGIGDAYLALGDPGAARRAWEQATEYASPALPQPLIDSLHAKLAGLDTAAFTERVSTAR